MADAVTLITTDFPRFHFSEQVRRLYVHALALLTRLAYGADKFRQRRAPDEGAQSRIRRINSELEFGPGAWEGSFLDSVDGVVGSVPVQHRRTGDGPFQFADACACLSEGMDAIVGDSLTRCFNAEPPEPFNFLTRNMIPGQVQPMYVTLLWLIGLWVRYCILLPIRVFVLVGGFCCFAIVYPLVGLILPAKPGSGASSPQVVVRKWMQRCLASIFVASWSGYVKFHGKRPSRQSNQIYVSNHTSLIDVFVLMKDYNFSCIGQRHTGLAGALQDLMGTAQRHVWFDRDEGRDRKAVQRLLKDHVADGSNEPMLVFPEGTCTTTDYCIMFKKGAFDLGATVYPIAMRYRKEFGDAFWNSTTASFPRHLFDLMTSWAVVCDVYYLEPESIQPGETTVQFANRVKGKICDRAGLVNVNWDGFLKRHRISPKFLAMRQKAIATTIMRRLNGEVPRPWSTSTLSALRKEGNASPDSRPSTRSTPYSGSPPLHGAGPSNSQNSPFASLSLSDSKSRIQSMAAAQSGPTSSRPVSVNAGAVSPMARVATAFSSAATDAFRWGVAFTLLAMCGIVSAFFIPKSWRDEFYAQFGR